MSTSTVTVGHAAAGASAPAVAAAPTRSMPTQRIRASKATRAAIDDLVRQQQIEDLVRNHQREVTRTIYTICRNWADAEEAVQEAVYWMWSHRPEFDRVYSPVGWFVGVAKVKLVNVRSARRKQCPALFGEHIERVEDPEAVEPTGEPCLADPEIMAQVQHALATLSPGHREVAELHCIEGLSIAEVAARTGRTRQAVRQALYEVLRLHKNWDGPEWHEKGTADPEAEALRTQVRLLAKLTPRVREAAWLRYVDGLPLDVVAARMKVPVKAVSNLLTKARQTARAELAERAA